MRRLTLVITLLLASGLAMSAAASVHAQSGLDEYQEGVPTPGGEAPGVPGGTDGSSGSATGGGVPGSSGTAGTAGTSAATGTDAATGNLTERQAAALGRTPSGQLAATGFDETGALALLGAALIAGGLVLRRNVRSATGAATAAD